MRRLGVALVRLGVRLIAIHVRRQHPLSGPCFVQSMTEVLVEGGDPVMSDQLRQADSAGCIHCGHRGAHDCYVDETELSERKPLTAREAALLVVIVALACFSAGSLAAVLLVR